MKMKKVLVILPEKEEYNQIIKTLSKEYEVIRLKDKYETNDFINNNHDDIVGFFFDATNAAKDGFEFTDIIHSDNRFVDITNIALTTKYDPEQLHECLNNNISEYIEVPCVEEHFLLRVKNAIRSKDSTSFREIERMLKELPSTIYLKDKEGKYVFSTHYNRHINTDGDPTWTIRGKTDIEIRKDKNNAQKAYESDMKILQTGIGTSYVIEESYDGITEYLELIKRPTHDEHGNVNGLIGLINDVTKVKTLEQELEKRSKTDYLTKIMNRRAAEEAIISKIENNNNCALVIIDSDNFKKINDTYGHSFGDYVLTTLAKVLKDNISETDVAGRIGGDEFILFINSADRFYISSLIEKISNEFKESFKDDISYKDISISAGISINYETLPYEDLFKLADIALYRVKNNNKGSFSIYK